MVVGEVGLHGPAVAVTAEDPTPDPVTIQLLPMEDQTALGSVDTPTPVLETVVQIKITEFMANGGVGHLGQAVERTV